jgi:DNA (cytosine-5)-methyltransferase 1
MKILNLYACLGGNRYKWGDEHEITAVELDPELARMYQERFPNDTVIVADAHQYLLDHYKEFDFIWSSPPCPTHSRARFARKESTTPEYPNMMLYQEIVFLQHWFDGKWVVENVIPYYEPLMPAQKRGRHLYWCNFTLPYELNERKHAIMESKDEVKKWGEFHEYDFTNYKGQQRIDKIARNLVDYEAGLTIFNTAMGILTKSNTKQLEIEL